MSELDEALADLARAYEDQRRPGYNHLMTDTLARAIERVLEVAHAH
jgi:hypothetical protein